jgi:hypothetical protein
VEGLPSSGRPPRRRPRHLSITALAYLHRKDQAGREVARHPGRVDSPLAVRRIAFGVEINGSTSFRLAGA